MGGRDRFPAEVLAKTGDGGLRACWDPDLREKELDNEGVAAEVIFPDADVLGIGGSRPRPLGPALVDRGSDDAELAFAGARAHNRWLADLCAANPVRRAGIMTVPVIHDIERGVEEIRRAYDSGVRGGVMIPSQWAPQASYNDPVYDPVWAVCQELDLTVAVHSGGCPAGYLAELGLAADLRQRGLVLRRPPNVADDLGGRLRALPRSQAGGHRERCVLGARDLADHGRRLCRDSQHPEVWIGLPGRSTREAWLLLPSELFHRDADDAPTKSASVTRSAWRTSSGETTSPTLKAHGRTPGTGFASATTTCPKTETRQILGLTRCGAIATSTPKSCRRSPTRSLRHRKRSTTSRLRRTPTRLEQSIRTEAP